MTPVTPVRARTGAGVSQWRGIGCGGEGEGSGRVRAGLQCVGPATTVRGTVVEVMMVRVCFGDSVGNHCSEVVVWSRLGCAFRRNGIKAPSLGPPARLRRSLAATWPATEQHPQLTPRQSAGRGPGIAREQPWPHAQGASSSVAVGQRDTTRVAP